MAARGVDGGALPLSADDDGPAAEGSPLRAPPAARAWFAAVKAGDCAAAGALLASRSHVDEGGAELRCERGGTALQWAAAEGHHALMRLLLAHGADVDARCSRAGGSALVWAASRNQVESLRLLLAAGADAGRPAPPAQTQSGWDVQSDGTPLGETPLMVAAQYGHAEAVAVLAAAGQLEAANEYGQRALHVAAMFGRVAAARALLRAGASLEARDGDGATPLALAAEHGHRDCALELLWRGADADAADGAGATPRDAAAAAGRDDVAAMLAAWARGELRRWSRAAHPHLPPPFRADVAATLLATLGSRRRGDDGSSYQPRASPQHRSSAPNHAPDAADSAAAASSSMPGCALAPGANPLRALREHSLFESLLDALLIAHMEGPPAPPPPRAQQPPPPQPGGGA